MEDDSTRHHSIFDYFFSCVFDIHGDVQGKERLYMEGHIRKSRRTKRLPEKYWDGTIIGYWWEDVKHWWDKRVAKKEKVIKQHLTDEIAPMERNARAEARAVIAPFVDRAVQLGLDLRIKYLYVTKEREEQNSRPAADYTYMAYMEISRPGETDEDKIVCVSADLLYVRLGKTAYRGVENKAALSELTETLTTAMTEICNKGLDAYYSEQKTALPVGGAVLW